MKIAKALNGPELFWDLLQCRHREVHFRLEHSASSIRFGKFYELKIVEFPLRQP